VHGLAPGNSQPMLVCIAEASARPAELILKNADCSPSSPPNGSTGTAEGNPVPGWASLF